MLYDRTNLIHMTTDTVWRVVIEGLSLVTLMLIVFLGDVRISLIAALTIPCSLLFAFSLMVLTGRSANLISLGAVDFGILVDAAVIVLENVYRQLHAARPGESEFEMIADSTTRGRKARVVFRAGDHRGVDSAFYNARRAGKNLRPNVRDVWICADGRAALCGFHRAGIVLVARIEAVAQRGYALGALAAARLRADAELDAQAQARGRGDRGDHFGWRRCFCTPLLGGEFMPKLEEGNHVGARDAAAGRFVRSGAADGARNSRNVARLSGSDAGGFADWAVPTTART